MLKKISQAAVLVSLMTTFMPTVNADSSLNRAGIPDSGSLLNELGPQRHITPRPEVPQVDVKVPTAKEESGQATAYIHKLVFDCEDLDVNERLQPLAAGKLDKKMTFADMQGLALAATNQLRKEGYMTALVYVPAQDLDGHVLHLKAMIGHYGDVNIKNTSRLTDERVLGYTYPVRPGQLIKSQPLDKSLLILNEIPGLQAKASLAPGVRPDTAKINIEVTNLEKQGGYAYVDNYGSKSTGGWRYGFNYHYDNLSRVGDMMELDYLRSSKGMNNYQFRYQIPVGRDGAIARVGYSHMNYEAGDRWTFLDNTGMANTLELGVTVPMKRSSKYSSWYDIVYRNRALDDSWFHDTLDSKKSSDSISLEVHGYVRENDYSDSYSIAQTLGNLGMDTEYARDRDSLLNTAGNYSKTNASLYHIQRLNNRWDLHASVTGQYAWKNLDSSEDFYVGGPDGVRAFPQGELGGDSGILGTLELRYRTGLPELQLTAFVDGARVEYDHDRIAGDTSDNIRNIFGAGLGLIYSKPRDWFAKFDWATPLGSHESTSEGETVHNAWWFRVVKQF